MQSGKSVLHPEAFRWPDELKRAFRAMVFDWDGTAIADRQSSAAELVQVMERTLRDGVLLIVITGTRFEHLDRQALGTLSPQAKQNLYVCTNRGSEVFGFTPGGEPVLRFSRTAIPEENAALDAAATRFQESLRAAYGLQTRIVRNRLNRRKIDLIPLPEWEDPKKSDLTRLLDAVQERLRGHGVFGGLKSLAEQAIRFARESGLVDPKVTSDVKHVEIGLTDKADSAEWARANLLEPYAIHLHDVVFLGDEFGDVGGLPGSDALMRSSLSDPDEHAAYVSVGPEPGGTGPGVHDLKGGPERFIGFLRLQSELRRARPVPPLWLRHSPTADPIWCVEQEGLDPSREREMEAIFSIGNGYLGVRGSLDAPIPSSQADLFVSGIYDKKVIRFPYSESEFLTPTRGEHPYSELVPLPTPFRLKLFVDGSPLTLVDADWSEHQRVLDLRKGMFFERSEFKNPEGRKTVVETFRCASMDDEHLLLHGVEIRSELTEGTLEIRFPLGTTQLATLYPHLVPEAVEGTSLDAFRCYRTHVSGFEIAVAARCSHDGKEIEDPHWKIPLGKGEPIRIRRIVSVYSSRETKDVREAARAHLGSLRWEEFDRAIAAHEARWGKLWERADVVFEGGPAATETQRFNSYHLLIAAPRRPDTSVGARTLSGRGYEGHVFWDSEIFVMPFYLHTIPEAARNILTYRHATLPEARKRARAMGLEGACFAWESTVTGEDVTPTHIYLRTAQKEIPILTGKQQIHVTADVAYGVCRYWKSTGDERFMLDFGVELLVETARFWATRCTLQGGLFHIYNVIGPDEYHVGVNDNAFTNWMAQFNLETAIDATFWMEASHPGRWQELRSRLGLADKERAEWGKISQAMYIPRPNEDGVIEQFEGFFDLGEHQLETPGQLRAPIGRLFEWEKINGLRLIKQADVLMLPFLFRNRFTRAELHANYRYYEPITDHGSSLSPSVHATIAAWIGDKVDLNRYYRQCAELDLFNLMQNSALGVHAANMGGAWQALVSGILGIRFDGSDMAVDPAAASRLLEEWRAIRMQLRHRGQAHPIHVRRTNGDES